jgi:hypothetical protein
MAVSRLDQVTPGWATTRPRRRRHGWIGPALSARLHGWELDHQLAAGASPRATAALQARARWITSPRNRRRVADGLARARDSAQTARPGFTAAVRPRAREVIDASTVLASLDQCLRGGEPVAPAGMAMLGLLLTDCTSPLYQPAGAGELGSRLRAAAATLTATDRHVQADLVATPRSRDEAPR